MKYSKQIEKKIKLWFDYFKRTVKDDNFHKYIEKEKEIRDKNHNEYLQNERPDLLNRTDHYEASLLSSVHICDVLTNHGINKLLKKIYRLNHKKYKVNNYYVRPTLFKKYDYINLQFHTFGYGNFAEIKFLDHEFIDSIDISWSQINNYFALMEYKFNFKLCLDDDKYIEFILSNIDTISSKDYRNWYSLSKESKEHNYSCLNKNIHEMFEIVCQHYITSLLYSEYGSISKLPSIIFYTRKDPIEIDKLFLGDMGYSYYNKVENFVIESNMDQDSYYLLAGNNGVPNFNICHLIFRYGKRFFYNIFGEKQIDIFGQEFSCYASGRKHINERKILKLLMIISGFNEVEKNKTDFVSKIHEEWCIYNGCDLIDFYDNKKLFFDYKKTYQDLFEQFKIRMDLHSSKIGRIISYTALIVSVITLITMIIIA